MKKLILVFISFALLASCSSKRNITTKKERSKSTEQVSKPSKPIEPAEPSTPKTPTYPNSVEAYIANFSAIAIEEMQKYKIPASITLAQGILESGSGQGRLAREANNHFGIKCHGWKGEKIYHDDDRSQECFRKYKYAKASFEDHSLFLTGRSRYSNLFTLRPDDYKGWAKGLRSAGYATDRKYPQKLISLIERYELYQFDQQVLGRSGRNSNSVSVQRSEHVVVKGDTLYSLSKRYNTTVEALKALNQLQTNELSIGQILIIK